MLNSNEPMQDQIGGVGGDTAQGAGGTDTLIGVEILQLGADTVVSNDHGNTVDGGGNDYFMREKEVKRRTTLSRTHRWRLEKRGLFPVHYKISENVNGWLASEIFTWIKTRPRACTGPESVNENPVKADAPGIPDKTAVLATAEPEGGAASHGTT